MDIESKNQKEFAISQMEAEKPEAETGLVPANHSIPSPIALSDLAIVTPEGEDLTPHRARVWGSARLEAIKATSPEDWVLFRAVDQQSGVERRTAYLQDSGCSRIRPILGIDIIPPDGKEFRYTRDEDTVEETDKDGNVQKRLVYAYSVTGNGYCRYTGRSVIGVVGTRYSTDKDAAEIKDPLRRKLRVKQNARVNLDGNITRLLSGLKVVSIDELAAAWEGTTKKIEKCTWGRGFADLRGADPTGPGGIELPVCNCGATMKYHASGTYNGRSYAAYYRCPEWRYDAKVRGDANGHEKIPATKWEKQVKDREAKEKAASQPEPDPGQPEAKQSASYPS